mgnify:CR=1 FL=1
MLVKCDLNWFPAHDMDLDDTSVLVSIFWLNTGEPARSHTHYNICGEVTVMEVSPKIGAEFSMNMNELAWWDLHLPPSLLN